MSNECRSSCTTDDPRTRPLPHPTPFLSLPCLSPSPHISPSSFARTGDHVAAQGHQAIKIRRHREQVHPAPWSYTAGPPLHRTQVRRPCRPTLADPLLLRPASDPGAPSSLAAPPSPVGLLFVVSRSSCARTCRSPPRPRLHVLWMLAPCLDLTLTAPALAPASLQPHARTPCLARPSAIASILAAPLCHGRESLSARTHSCAHAHAHPVAAPPRNPAPPLVLHCSGGRRRWLPTPSSSSCAR